MSLTRRKPMNRGKGFTAPRKRLRAQQDANLAAWGRKVRTRDEHICQFPKGCFTDDPRIDPHHIATRGRRPDLIYVDANGICLCRTHHTWVHDNPIQATQMELLNDRTRELAAAEGTLGIR